MSHVVACYKWVLDEADIKIADDLSVDTGSAQHKISKFDKSALAAAAQAAPELDAEPVAVSYGDTTLPKSKKDALSRGAESGVLVVDEDAGKADSKMTSHVLAAAIERIGDVRIAFAAEGADDTYAREVGPRLAARLGWPAVTSAVDVSIDGDAAIVTRKLEDRTQTVRAELPCVVCVLPEGFAPKTPGLKDLLKADKKPVEELSLSDLGIEREVGSERTDMHGFSMDRKNQIIEGDSIEEVATTLAETLKKEGVIS